MSRHRAPEPAPATDPTVVHSARSPLQVGITVHDTVVDVTRRALPPVPPVVAR